MDGGGIAYTLDSSVKDVTKCLMEAVMRDDTLVKPLTFSSLSGFIMIMHRPGGLVDATDTIFLRSTTIKTDGNPMVRATAKRQNDGMVIDTIIIKFMIMTDEELEQFTYNGEDFDKGNVTRDEVIAEQRNHMAVYSAFNTGDIQIIPSIVGNIVSLTIAKTNKVLELLKSKTPAARHTGSILAFEYFLKELNRLNSVDKNSRLVAIFIEKVGHDSGADDFVVVKHVAEEQINTKTRDEDSIFKSPSPPRATRSADDKIEGKRKRNIIRAAAIGACATQLMTMNKTQLLLVDAHNGNWFINNRSLKRFFAIDFGRLVPVNRQILRDLYLKYVAKNFPAGVPPGSIFFPVDQFDAKYAEFEGIISVIGSFIIGRKSDVLRVFTNIHKCLVMAAIFDNIVTDDNYADWDQPQMVWAYKQIWGYTDTPNAYGKQPVSNFPRLLADYSAFTAGISVKRLRHIVDSYTRLAEIIVEVNAMVATGSSQTRPDSTTTRPQQFITWIGGSGGGRGSSRRRHLHNNNHYTMKNRKN
jgi:hypothetical protein